MLVEEVSMKNKTIALQREKMQMQREKNDNFMELMRKFTSKQLNQAMDKHAKLVQEKLDEYNKRLVEIRKTAEDFFKRSSRVYYFNVNCLLQEKLKVAEDKNAELRKSIAAAYTHSQERKAWNPGSRRHSSTIFFDRER